jgi:hypothetical protein
MSVVSFQCFQNFVSMVVEKLSRVFGFLSARFRELLNAFGFSGTCHSRLLVVYVRSPSLNSWSNGNIISSYFGIDILFESHFMLIIFFVCAWGPSLVGSGLR